MLLKLLNISNKSSIILYDINKARKRLLELPWVKNISIMKLYPNILNISISEKKPYALWKYNNITYIIDKNGNIITNKIQKKNFNHLILLKNNGAQKKAKQIIDLLNYFPILYNQTKIATLINNRRWNLLINKNIIVYLPEKYLKNALKKLDKIEKNYHILSKKINIIDMRIQDRLVIRLNKIQKYNKIL